MIDLLVGLDLLHSIDSLLAHTALFARRLCTVLGVVVVLCGRCGQETIRLLLLLSRLWLRFLLLLLLRGVWARRSGELLGDVGHLGRGRLHFARLLLECQELVFERLGAACLWDDLFFDELRVHVALKWLRLESIDIIDNL